MVKNTASALPRMVENVTLGWDAVWASANHQAVGAGLVAALCLPALLLMPLQGPHSLKKPFKMGDSPSIRLSSEMSTLPWTLVAGLCVGLLTAAIRAQAVTDGTDAVSWAMLATYTVVVQRRSPRRSLTSIFVGIVSGLCLASTAVISLNERFDNLSQRLNALQALSAILVVAGYLMLPRRPDETRDNRQVDREHCGSIYEQITFSWCKLLFETEKLANIGITDLPLLKSTSQADHLARIYTDNAGNGQGHYRIAIAKTHAWRLITLNLLTVLRAAAPLAPQAARFLLLQRLEDTVLGTDFYGIGLALGAGALSVCEIWIESYVSWYLTSQVHIPIRSTISSLVYRKTLRLRSDQAQSGASGSAEKRKTISNYLSTDSVKAVMIYTDSTKLVRAAANLITTGAFLINLMGWKGVAAGIVASLIPIPLIKWQSKRVRNDHHLLSEQHDKRSALLADALNAIRQLKLTATDVTWRQRLSDYRQRELSLMWTEQLEWAWLIFVGNISPDILTAIPIYIFAIQNRGMSAAVAFTSIDLFLQLQSELSILPFHFTYLSEGWTSAKRLQEYFAEPEISPQQGVSASDISLEDATIKWLNDEKEKSFALHNVSASFPAGNLTVVAGETGAGKSLLLTALAGEADIVSGTYRRPQKMEVTNENLGLDDNWTSPNHVAIVTQTPWIENGTVRDNILLGLPMQEDRYNEALYSCTLDKEVSAMEKGDLTIVGPKGAAMSGGQRCRVALARALYSCAGVLILDDVLSAVDAEVREWLVDKALAGNLAKGRTRILATHYASQCEKKAARLVQLEGGTVKYQKEMQVVSDETIAQELETPGNSSKEHGISEPRKGGSEMSAEKGSSDTGGQVASKVTRTKRSPWYPYVAYFKAAGGVPSFLFASSMYIGYEMIRYSKTWWLKEWTDQGSKEFSGNASTMYYGGVFVMLSTANCLGTVFKGMASSSVGIKASATLFEHMATAVFGSSLQWLEGTSHGEITMRFGADTSYIDERLSSHIWHMFTMIYSIISILLASVSVSPYMACVAGILLYIYYSVARRLIQATTYLQRISATGMRAMLDHIASVAAPDGISTIRAYGMTGYFTKRMHGLIDDRLAAWSHYFLCETMMDFQLGSLGVVFLTFVAVAAVLTKSSPGDAAIALTFATRFRRAVVGLLTKASSIESGMEHVRKVAEYGELKTEPTSGLEPSPQWPSEGKVEASGFSAGYSRELPPALKKVTFSISPRERVGIVGRTGAGKTSLTLAFARLIECFEGDIVIDGVDIATLDLHALRRRLFIIPQDPHLFAGTVRSVLDPEGEHTDEALLNALKLMRSTDTAAEKVSGIESMFTDLSMEISQGGRNISQGQRQILYLARAFVSASKVVIMDEATSAIDLETDAVIQEGVRKGLPGSTVIVVAHRLATIADFDKVLVLDGGEVAEFGPPGELYAKQGAFWNLVQHSADKEELVNKMSCK